MTKLEQIKALSPVPIEYGNVPDGYYGWFYHSGINSGSQHISIEDNLDEECELTTLVHEIIHARHLVRHCECYSGKSFEHKVLRELHAYKVEIAFCIKYELDQRLRRLILAIKHESFGDKLYNQTAKRLRRTQIYKKALEHLKL